MMIVWSSMIARANRNEALRWLGMAAAVALTTFLLARFGASDSTAGLIYLTLVVWAATQVGVTLALTTALVCAILFDFFFLPPFHTFVLAGTPEYVAMFAFTATSMVASRVAERARLQARQAVQRREDVERLYSLSQEMMLHDDPTGLAQELPRLIRRVFDLDEVVLHVIEHNQMFGTEQEPPRAVCDNLRSMAQTQGSLDSVTGFSAMPLLLGLRPVGALAWKPATLSREVSTAVGAQVAIALTRALAIEISMHLEATREGERLRTALIDSLTHELRTPLTSIRAASSTLMQGESLDSQTRAELAAVVDEESARLDALIGAAIEMAEIDAHVVQVRMLPQHTRTLLDMAVEESADLLVRHRVVLDVEEPDLPVWFDARLLGRVLRHLLENAASYCPPGSTITLRSRRFQGRLLFIVEDNGPGIDAAELPMIFEKFYRGSKGARVGKGSGMGLAIVRAILAVHGGGIEASSPPGHGASFRFWVPLLEREPSGAHRRLA
jgi:two-component system, OmpR family, sensor histidine kinase KdpD